MTDQQNTHTDEFDWDNPTTSGLLDEYVGTVQSSRFGIDTDYQSDTIRALWDIEIVSHDDPDNDKQPGDIMSEAFNVGNTSTWETFDNGKRVSRVDGKAPRFHESGGYGRLIQMAVPGKKNSMAGADKLVEVLRSRGGATRADIWEGLTFRFKRLEFSFKDRETGDQVTYSRTYPIEFVGEGTVASATPADAPVAAAAPTASSTPADFDRSEVLALAAEHDTFGDFLAAAMSKFPGIETSDLAGEVMDEQNGIFAEAKS